MEPAFDLVDEGLGARIDPSRPATVRAYVPARDRAAADRAVAEVAEALGHLQAFGLRPIGDLQTRLVDEADWAEAWKAYFPVLRVGRRLVIRPTWRRHRRSPDDVVLALDPGMAFGTGLHPDDPPLPGRGGGPRGPGRTRRAPASSTSAAGAGSSRSRRCGWVPGARSAWTPTRSRSRRRPPTRGAIASVRRITARAGSLPSGESPFDVVLANLIAGVLVPLAGALHDELRPGGSLVASGIFVDREAEVRTAFEAAGLIVDRRTAEGEWVALDAHRPA